jgi:glutamate synthase (NADPH/NADH) large chain
MSGGIAYVYDPAGDFDRKVNYEMVDVEHLDDSDRQYLREMIERHQAYTDSAVAKRMLASWSVEVSRFRKVMPTDYKRVLTVIEEAEAAGLDEETTVDRIMEAARG